MCVALAEGGNAGRLVQNAQQRVNMSTDEVERALCFDRRAFLQKMAGWEGNMYEWLQAASQESDDSFLSKGAASTAQSVGLPLVRWVGKPQGTYPGSYTLPGHAGDVQSAAMSRDGKRVVTASTDTLVIIWNAETGAEVCILA